MKLTCTVSFLILGALSLALTSPAQVLVSAPPSWVEKNLIENFKILDTNTSSQYLLIEHQDNLELKSKFRRYVYQVLNAEGVQDMSDISVTYDPNYQQLVFNDIRIIRDGKEIAKLRADQFQVIQRETSMERALYDGSLTAVFNLGDVRVKDIIDYSYTINGFNPIYKNHYNATFYHQYSIPVNKIVTRLLIDPGRFIQFKTFEGATNPVMSTVDGLKEYKWHIDASDFKLIDSNIPSWLDVHRRVSFSTFRDWSEVVEWAVPLYKFDAKISTDEILSRSKYQTPEMKVLAIIRGLQDDIRYLGFESGIAAYQPRPPSQVLEQRFGDCKEKSLLLASLLRKEGVEAYPMLVNTTFGKVIPEELPGFNAFDHCVVAFNFEGTDYFIDPTISNQGGDLKTISFPNYRNGLILKSGSVELTALPETVLPSINIKEIISVQSIGGGASFVVRTEYTGAKADYMRSYFSNNSREEIQKEYLNYYSRLYAGIKMGDTVRYYDYDRLSTNKIIVEEFYEIDTIWNKSDDSSYIYCEAYPIVLESDLNFPKVAKRSTPYVLGTPYVFEQNTLLEMPEEWSGTDTNYSLDKPAFLYRKNTSINGKTASVNHYFELKEAHIPGEAVGTFTDDIEKIKSEFSYLLTYRENLTGFRLSWLSLTILLVSLGVGIVLAYRINKIYNPVPWKYAEDKQIGGWLILPAIGICFSPISLILQFADNELLNANVWTGLEVLEPKNSFKLYAFVTLELIYNGLYFIFCLFVIVVFFKRRTSAPRLISILYIVNLVVPVIDSFITEDLMPGTVTESDKADMISQAVRTFIAAAIWIPYFNMADRVKSTFCKRVND